MMITVTTFTKVVASLQEQQQEYKEIRRTRDIQTENARIARDTVRDRERKEAETERKQQQERRHKQAQIKRQIESDKNQVKLIEAEAQTINYWQMESNISNKHSNNLN